VREGSGRGLQQQDQAGLLARTHQGMRASSSQEAKESLRTRNEVVITQHQRA